MRETDQKALVIDSCLWCGRPEAPHSGGFIDNQGKEHSGSFCDQSCFDMWLKWNTALSLLNQKLAEARE